MWKAMQCIALSILVVTPAAAELVTVEPRLDHADDEGAWAFCGGEWEVDGGELRQTDPWAAENSFGQTGHAFLKAPAFGDLRLRFEFLVEKSSRGVGAAEVLLRSTDSRTYTLLHLTTKARGVYLTHNDHQSFWRNIMRASDVDLPRGEWVPVTVEARGPKLRVSVRGELVLQAEDDTLAAGLVGFGSSQAIVRYRNIKVEGYPARLEPPWRDVGGKFMKPEYKVICEDAGAGGYEAFPDICRCANGDLLCVFYAGYEHVSFPTEDLPKGARVCSVRSADDGETWDPAEVVADTPWDDRDPSITCLENGRLLCNWFTYYGGRDEARPGNTTHYKELWLSASDDHGRTWSEPHLIPGTADAYWGCSSPIIELRDGDLLWPIYREYTNPLRNWSAVIRSGDGGETWSEPVWVDETNADNDEPALLELPSGRTLCLMRTNGGDSMWRSVSDDGGLTWRPSEKVGFPGQAPYLFRTEEGVILLGHRVPGTSLHTSLDDGETWSDTVPLDTCIGAYPSMVRRGDGAVLIVYYEEGVGSSIRAQKLKVTTEGVESIPWEG